MVNLIKRRWVKVSILAIVIMVISVTLFNIFNNGKDIKSSQDFIKALKSKGYNVETIEVPKNKFQYFESSNSHKSIIINNSSYINFYEFETEELAKSASETISKDANKIGKTYVHWGTAVKFYTKGNIIVQYEGTDFNTLWHLRIIMGKSVASSEFTFLLYKKFINLQTLGM
jgi:hypothetical protein